VGRREVEQDLGEDAPVADPLREVESPAVQRERGPPSAQRAVDRGQRGEGAGLEADVLGRPGQIQRAGREVQGARQVAGFEMGLRQQPQRAGLVAMVSGALMQLQRLGQQPDRAAERRLALLTALVVPLLEVCDAEVRQRDRLARGAAARAMQRQGVGEAVDGACDLAGGPVAVRQVVQRHGVTLGPAGLPGKLDGAGIVLPRLFESALDVVSHAEM
jgi:hypothetical protein